MKGRTAGMAGNCLPDCSERKTALRSDSGRSHPKSGMADSGRNASFGAMDGNRPTQQLARPEAPFTKVEGIVRYKRAGVYCSMLDYQRNAHSLTTNSSRAIEVLRAAANGKAFDEERASSDIKAAVDGYCAAAIYTSIHKDQKRSRDAEKALEPLLRHLHKLGERLDSMTGETWRDWRWTAANAYSELPDVREELDRWNAALAEDFADTDVDLCDYVKTEVDQVGRDLAELRSIVAKVEPRLRAVVDALMANIGKDGRPPLVARKALFFKLRTIYERDTGEKATAIKDQSELGAHSRFVDFVVAVNQKMRPSLPYTELGTAVKNFLYPPKSKSPK